MLRDDLDGQHLSAFLGVSVARSRRLRRGARAAVLGIESPLGGSARRVWGDVRPGRSLLLSWEREDRLGSVVRHGGDDASMVCGVSAPVGTWSRIAIGVDGAVEARCDDLGYGSLFHWVGDGIAAVSTRPELLVAVAAAVGEVVARDPSIASELAHVGWLDPARTGWREIAALRAGESIRLVDGGASVTTDPQVAAWADEPPAVPLADLVEQAADVLLDNVRRTLETGRATFADLTAGRDSRMVVAALVALDALDSVTLQTIGDPGLADVDQASALAARLGAVHRHGYFYPLPEGTFGERFRRHVEATAGVANVMEGMREPLAGSDHVRLSGLVGEVVRGWPNPVRRDAPASEVPGAVARAFNAGCLDLLGPDALEDARTRLEAEVVARGGVDLPGAFAAHRYYGEVRLRARLSRVDDFTSEVRAYPLYSRELTAVGMAMMWHHPGVDLADRLIERLAPGLDSVGDAADTSGAPSAEAVSFMQAALAEQAQTRRDFFAAVAEMDSAAWDHIDRSTYTAAVGRYDELSNSQLRLLHGAAGGVIWAAGGRDPDYFGMSRQG